MLRGGLRHRRGDTTTTASTAGPGSTTTASVSTGSSDTTAVTGEVDHDHRRHSHQHPDHRRARPPPPRSLSSAEKRLANGHIKAMGYIDKVYIKDGKRYISIDYAEMLTGQAAIDAAVAAGEIAPGEDLPNDYWISNDNPQKRVFEVSGHGGHHHVHPLGARR